MTDALGNVTRYEFDSLYRLVTVTEAIQMGQAHWLNLLTR